MGYSLWGNKESDKTEVSEHAQVHPLNGPPRAVSEHAQAHLLNGPPRAVSEHAQAHPLNGPPRAVLCITSLVSCLYKW